MAAAGPLVGTSHSRTVRSSLVVASQVPSGAIAQPVTGLVWSVRAVVQVPVVTSHSRAVLSLLVVASHVGGG
jgi:hypothetical protein